MNTVIIFLSFLFLTNVNSQILEPENRIINIQFTTILKNSDDVIPLTVTEIISGTKRIGVVFGDYDGISSWNVCSRKIIDNKITLKIFGINCTSFKKEYEIKDDVNFNIKLEYGESKFKSKKDRELFIYNELGIPFCGTTNLFMEELENAEYQHCDGRIKRFNEIPDKEKYQWDKIEN